MTLISTVLLMCLSGWLYRQGGSADKPKWLWKARDVGSNLCVIGWLLLNGFHSWWLVLSFGLMWASLSSYFNKKNAEERWWNFALHGFFIGFSLLPLAIIGDIAWLHFGIRCLAMAMFFGMWTQIEDNAVVSEVGRGVFMVLSLPVLLYG